MEMKEIDLTKCANCRFRAEISNSGPVSGRIVVDKGVYLEDEKGDFIGALSLDGEELMCFNGCGFTDFEIVPRDPETYRDWQVGDKVCEMEHKNACYEVIFRSGELVVFKDWNNWASNPMTCSEAFTRFGMRLVLTDIEQQIIEEKKKYEPQGGDICYVEDTDGYCSIFIYKNGFHRTNYYASLDTDKGCSTLLFTTGGHVVANSKITVLRPATEDEKQRLFDAMAKEGKRWNAEKKVVEDILKPHEFKKGEPVLVRDYENEWWRIALYDCEDKMGFFVKTANAVAHWNQCIPYNERTMHLLGTAEDYKEGK